MCRQKKKISVSSTASQDKQQARQTPGGEYSVRIRAAATRDTQETRREPKGPEITELHETRAAPGARGEDGRPQTRNPGKRKVEVAR